MLSHEHRYWADNPGGQLAGVDEAGRGPLAGPVVAAAVCMSEPDAEQCLKGVLAGLTDSKKLTERRREVFFAWLQESAAASIGVGIAEPAEIDAVNILCATHRAMARAVAQLDPPVQHVLVDGLPVRGLPCDSTAIVKGDAKSLLIAAASVVAKVLRDRRMVELDARYGGYGFARNKGYGTQEHARALLRLGPCPAHRRSFRPVSELGQMHLPGFGASS